MPHYCKREVWTLASRVKGAAQVLFFFLHLLRFLDFRPSLYVWASFHVFSRRADIFPSLHFYRSCPQDCQTQIMTRVDQHISRLNTSLKRRKICRSSEREKYEQNVFIILFVEIFTCKEYWQSREIIFMVLLFTDCMQSSLCISWPNHQVGQKVNRTNTKATTAILRIKD